MLGAPAAAAAATATATAASTGTAAKWHAAVPPPEASRTRSYLPDGTLAPGSLREGELVFRLTDEQKPQALELEGALGLSVPLHQM